MTVHVDSLTSEVVAEPEAEPAPARAPAPAPAPPWEAEAQLRALRERAARDALRTAAEDEDD